MQSLPPDYLAKLRFDTQQLATLRALGEYGGKQRLYVAQSPEVLSDLRRLGDTQAKRAARYVPYRLLETVSQHGAAEDHLQ
jgi:hypothetical protein